MTAPLEFDSGLAWMPPGIHLQAGREYVFTFDENQRVREVTPVERTSGTVNKISLPEADRAAEASLWRLAQEIHYHVASFDWGTFLRTLRELEQLDFHERANILHFTRENLSG